MEIRSNKSTGNELQLNVIGQEWDKNRANRNIQIVDSLDGYNCIEHHNSHIFTWIKQMSELFRTIWTCDFTISRQYVALCDKKRGLVPFDLNRSIYRCERDATLEIQFLYTLNFIQTLHMAFAPSKHYLNEITANLNREMWKILQYAHFNCDYL